MTPPEKMTVAEFRKQIKMALDYCVQGGTIEIERMGQRFMLTAIPRGMEVLSGGTTKEDKPYPPLTEMYADGVKKLVKKNKSEPKAQREATPRDTDKSFEFCQHGAVKGMCKKGCK